MCFFITSQTNKKRTLTIKTMTELDETNRENCANWQICSAKFILIDGLIYSFRVCSAPYSVFRYSHDDKWRSHNLLIVNLRTWTSQLIIQLWKWIFIYIKSIRQLFWCVLILELMISAIVNMNMNTGRNKKTLLSAWLKTELCRLKCEIDFVVVLNYQRIFIKKALVYARASMRTIIFSRSTISILVLVPMHVEQWCHR